MFKQKPSANSIYNYQMISVSHSKLSSTLTTSQVITGLWQIADMERDGNTLELEKLAKAMIPYAEAGLTTFDMADHYGSAEDIAGIFHKQFDPEHKVKLFTKWVPKPGPVTRKDVRDAIETSLRRLQSERLELLQFHTWTYADPSWLDCLFYLQELKDEGLINNLGLTNVDTVHLNMVLQSGIKVISNQVCFSLLDQRPAKAMTELCLKHGVKILAYGTLAGGFLSERWLNQSEPQTLATWSQMKYKRFIDQIGGWEAFQHLLQTLNTVAQNLNVSIANVASKFIMENEAVGAVIIGARLGERAHITETLKLFDFTIDTKNRKRIQDTLAQLKTIPGDSGDEYRKPPFLTASGDLSHHLESFPAPFEVKEINGRSIALSGTKWEAIASYARAVRQGDRILVSGTTATHKTTLIGGNDPAAQTHFIIDKIEASLKSLGGKLDNVVRTRVFINNLSDWEAVSRAHGARFSEVMPANTLVVAGLVGDGYLVEIEAEAIIN
jgi:aryl-alcohol dehydrogenase-like predicted oxidoreductase/enamine deaminase RidA (YjgF/YER057c/UK114 family)